MLKAQTYLLKQLASANVLVRSNKFRSTHLDTVLDVVLGDNSRVKRFITKVKDLKEGKAALLQRWKDVAEKLFTIYTKKLVDITLKDLQKELKAGQTEAKLDVNKYLKKYDDNIWKYFEEEIKKTKYAAMLDELKEYKTELYELTEYRGKNIKGATEYIMESIHDKYVESQGFDVEDDHKSSVSPTQITPIIISWKNKISAEEWQKYWDLFQHMYYHNYIAVHIEEDLDQNQKPGAWTKDEDTQDDVGYNRSGTKNLFEKYGNLPWEEAYKKAIEFHRNAVEEDSKKIEEWRTEHMLNFNPWDLMHITNNHTKIDKWVDNFLQVGEEPSEPPIKLDPPTPDMLKKATKEED